MIFISFRQFLCNYGIFIPIITGGREKKGKIGKNKTRQKDRMKEGREQGKKERRKEEFPSPQLIKSISYALIFL
jgi:hypothetical protein